VLTVSGRSGRLEGKKENQSMQLNVPPDLEALVQKRLATGAFADAEEVIRRALETQDAEESWTEEERRALDEKIDQALGQVAAGLVYGPEEARRKLAALREAHLANLG
jgi:Arc/MetJ-type ribon-helix-helix transcriptional regulator